jgi:hypothetical protein
LIEKRIFDNLTTYEYTHQNKAGYLRVRMNMATKRQGLQLAQTAFPDYFSEPINTNKNTTEKDYIGVQDFVRRPSCSKQNNSKSEKQHKATYQEIFEWFQKEYGLPNLMLGNGESERQVTKPSIKAGKAN